MVYFNSHIINPLLQFLELCNMVSIPFSASVLSRSMKIQAKALELSAFA